MKKIGINRRNIGIRGFSLLELIIALVVFTIGLIPTISMFMKMRKGIENRDEVVKAALLGQNLLEQIRSKKWDENTPTPAAYISNPTPADSLGVDSGEDINNSSTFDDIDDFNGFTNSPAPGYTSTVVVNYVSLDLTGNAGSTAIATSPKNYKEIIITIKSGNGSKTSQTIKCLMANAI